MGRGRQGRRAGVGGAVLGIRQSSTAPPCAKCGSTWETPPRVESATTRTGRKVAFSNCWRRPACPDPARQLQSAVSGFIPSLFFFFISSFPLFLPLQRCAQCGVNSVSDLPLCFRPFYLPMLSTRTATYHDVLVPAALLLSSASSSCMFVLYLTSYRLSHD